MTPYKAKKKKSQCPTKNKSIKKGQKINIVNISELAKSMTLVMRS
jgi:hypothetical protein